MSNSSLFNLDECSLSNDLWPDFINKIGFIKAKLAVRQSLDLQSMQGSNLTILSLSLRLVVRLSLMPMLLRLILVFLTWIKEWF